MVKKPVVLSVLLSSFLVTHHGGVAATGIGIFFRGRTELTLNSLLECYGKCIVIQQEKNRVRPKKERIDPCCCFCVSVTSDSLPILIYDEASKLSDKLPWQ